jgi:hypothetical protein
MTYESEATVTTVVDVLTRWPVAYLDRPVQYYLPSKSLAVQIRDEMLPYDINNTSYDTKKQYFTANSVG